MLNWALIFALGMAWGSSFYFNAVLLRELGPLTVALGRVGVGALACWLWLILARKSWRIPPVLLLPMSVFALVQYAIPLALYPYVQQYITSSAAGIVNAMTPIMVVIVSQFWPGGERATWTKSIGVALGFAGIVVLVSPAFAGQGPSNPWALLATMGAPLCYGIALNLMRRFDGMDRTVLTAWSLLLGTAFLVPVALGSEGMPVITRAETWVALFVIGAILTAAAFILLFWLIPRVGGTTASTITLIAPVSAVLLGAYLLSEDVSLPQLVGMGIILLGLLFVDGRLSALLRGHRNVPPVR
ncbi:ABC transporter permease [Actibacterium mucosum KCTC 23349]|uniref:ABC transporter permease n=1 Tax=Actibacterium mucosum KCTC 23349 TaxID=1454373 RepID=A0A037ZGL7_9RHOB|nr:DMT family transporter [Actibacterium mucosum]KAJ54686.1 ABC transporter permease [Actibacterium mucosum KCTC 23349]